MPDADLAAVAARFAARLHDVGVEAGPDRAARFAESLHLARPLTNDDVYWLGRVTLTGHRDEIAAYDRVFTDVFLGVAECDARGNVNVSRFGDRLAGCGGAINLTQRTRQVVFMTPFSSGGLDVQVGDGSLRILEEGRFSKFVKHADHLNLENALVQESPETVPSLQCVVCLSGKANTDALQILLAIAYTFFERST